jgi:RNA polymerase sigma-70 factor (ECF subfamily)
MEKTIITYNGQEIKVDKAVADYLEIERLREQAEKRSDKRHLSDKDINREDIDSFLSDKPTDFTEQIANDSEAEYLCWAINALTDTQRRRVQMYFFDGFSYARIAEFEGVSKTAVGVSINAALEKLKIFFK